MASSVSMPQTIHLAKRRSMLSAVWQLTRLQLLPAVLFCLRLCKRSGRQQNNEFGAAGLQDALQMLLCHTCHGREYR